MAYISRSERDVPSTHSGYSSAGSSPNPGASPAGLHRGVSLGGQPGTKQLPDSLPVTPAEGCGPGLLPNAAMPERPEPRERSTSSPSVPGAARRRDIWDVLSGLLGKAIQPLVSTQLLKPAVARQLLGEHRSKAIRIQVICPLLTRTFTALPIHPRSLRQTRAVLRSPAMQHSWLVEEEETLVLPHPAWVGLEHDTVSPASYADHTLQVSPVDGPKKGHRHVRIAAQLTHVLPISSQLLKIFWESEIRTILREALLSRAASEWILDSLWDIARVRQGARDSEAHD